jgi:hypothetical protein
MRPHRTTHINSPSPSDIAHPTITSITIDFTAIATTITTQCIQHTTMKGTSQWE